MNSTETTRPETVSLVRLDRGKIQLSGVRRSMVYVGLSMTGAILVWLILGGFGGVSSMVEVFGIAGLRIPAGIAIGGLLIAAVGFNKF